MSSLYYLLTASLSLDGSKFDFDSVIGLEMYCKFGNVCENFHKFSQIFANLMPHEFIVLTNKESL